MSLANFVAFLVLNILYIFVSMQINADIGKILKNVRVDLTFTFDVFTKSHIGFVSFFVSLAVENVSFLKTYFY